MKITIVEAENFLYREARLLDERRLEEWLELFTQDGIYWIPIVDGSDPEREPSILYDDTSRRAQRVYQILHQPRYAQKPPSRTVHMVSNVELEGENSRGDEVLRCNLAVFELRAGGQEQYGLGVQRSVVGHCEYHLRYEGLWRMALKKVLLIDRDLPIRNFTFVV